MSRIVYLAMLTALVLPLALACAPAAPPPAAAPQAPAPAAAPGQAGWQQKWDQLVAAARKEGKVMMYGEVGPDLRTELAQALQKEFGIELDVVSGKAPEVAQRFLSEDQANVHLADILLAGQTTTVTVIKPRGVLASIPPLLVLPEVTDPKVWKEGRVPYLDKDQTALPLVASYRSFLLINTEMVSPKDIQSYYDLLRPEFKGKITLYDPTIGGSGSTWVGFMNRVVGADETKKFLQQLALQDVVITRDARLHVESVAKKKYALGLGASSQVVADFQKAQAPIEWAKVKEGGMVLAGAATVAVPRKVAHPNATAVFINWLLTKEGQSVFVKGYGHPARRSDVANTGVDPSVIPPEGEKILWLDEDFVLTEPKLMPMSRDIFAPLMK
ncbi:MAG: extracellular solute-binding protein [Chloroflexi bacterium]|nr:extracellular solute-binding protein [Chloroflexota bacterium]